MGAFRKKNHNNYITFYHLPHMKQGKNKAFQASPERVYIFSLFHTKIVHFYSSQTESGFLLTPNCNSALTIQHKIQAPTGNV